MVVPAPASWDQNFVVVSLKVQQPGHWPQPAPVATGPAGRPVVVPAPASSIHLAKRFYTLKEVHLPTPQCSRKHPPPSHISGATVAQLASGGACASQLGPELCSCFIRLLKVRSHWPSWPASGGACASQLGPELYSCFIRLLKVHSPSPATGPAGQWWCLR